MSIFVEDLISSARLRTLAPLSQNTFEVSDLITIGNEELLLKIVSDLKKVREDFFVTTQTTPIVANVDHYGIPSRAVGNSFTALFFVDSSGAQRALVKVDASRLDQYQGSGEPTNFYMAGDEVVLLPKPTLSSGSLMFLYERKPNRLVPTASCAKIIGVSVLGDAVTFDVNTDLTEAIQVGAKVDILSSQAPFLLWADGVTLLAISSTQMQVPLAEVSNAAGAIEPQVGDFLCPMGFANIPMIPEEFHPVLAQMIGVRLLAALGDLNKWNAAKAELKEVRDEAVSLIKNRVQSSPLRVSGRNGLLSAMRR